MFTQILAPLDGSPVAAQMLPFAQALAAALKAPLTLFSVIDSAPLLTSAENARRFDTLIEQVTRQAEIYLKETAEGMSGSTVDWRVEQGDVAEAIIGAAAVDPRALVAMATHGRSGLKRWLLGSVAEKVLRGSTNPLLLVNANDAQVVGDPPVRSIIVALDGSELAETVLPTAMHLARQLNAELLLARASEIPATAYYRGEGYESAAQYMPSYDEMLRAATEEARDYLQKKVEELQRQGVQAVRPVELIGPAAEKLIDLAQATEASLIAMCSHGRSGVTRWILGSVAEKVVRHAGAPVLLLRAR